MEKKCGRYADAPAYLILTAALDLHLGANPVHGSRYSSARCYTRASPCFEFEQFSRHKLDPVQAEYRPVLGQVRLTSDESVYYRRCIEAI